MRPALAVASSALLALATAAAAPAQTVVIEPDGTIVASCRAEVRLFRSLRDGFIDYCRGHLRYMPGALDCQQFVDQVCLVLLPGRVDLVETRRQGGPAYFPCPDGPAPPVCPKLTFR